MDTFRSALPPGLTAEFSPDSPNRILISLPSGDTIRAGIFDQITEDVSGNNWIPTVQGIITYRDRTIDAPQTFQGSAASA